MEDNDITSESLPGAQDVGASDGKSEAVGSESAKSFAKQVSELLGKDFVDDESAAKAIKDTFSYVGKKREQIAEEVKRNDIDMSKFVPREQYEEDQFFAKHPEYSELKSIIRDGARANNVSVDKYTETEAFKTLFGKVSGFEEVQKKKSVLESNPRLGMASDKAKTAVEKIRESSKARATGDSYVANKLENEARSDAVSSVIEAYDLG